MSQKRTLHTDYTYHIISRSIDRFTIFNQDSDYSRFLTTLTYNNNPSITQSYSENLRLPRKEQFKFKQYQLSQKRQRLANLICYCLMPTHIHLVLKQLVDNGIVKLVGDTLNGYTRYFNTKHKRKGPLWESRFKDVFVSTDEQMMHLTRYVHLNPTSAGLVKHPQDWEFSSFLEYTEKDYHPKICFYKDALEINKKHYYQFVVERVGYQRELSKIKKLILKNYSG